MNEEQRYEEMMRKQMDDLPLPDMNGAWEDMQRKLDNDGEKRRVIPFAFLNCLGIALLALLLVGGWYFLLYDKDNESNKKQASSQQVENTTTKQPNAPFTPSEQIKVNSTTTEADKNRNQKGMLGDVASSDQTTDQHSSLPDVVSVPTRKVTVNTNKTDKRSERLFDTKRTNKKSKTFTTTTSLLKTHKQGTTKNRVAISATDNTTMPATSVEQLQPTIIWHKADHPIIQQQVSELTLPVDSSDKKKEEKKKKMYVTAGLGLQQAIPLGGQSTVPYNYYGRTGSLYDYIPSVYLRLHKQKWFLQTEFRFGAPQTVKEFSFAQKTNFDTASNSLSISSFRLKKTYYHQIPITFNYQFHKNFSIGLGGMYSYFYGAVTEEVTRSQNITTGDEKISRKIVPVKGFTDSFLYKTQVHLLLQTDYHWKRFNIGLRYSTDLQPYIKYTLPDGTVRTEKNHSLQVFLRYRLFPGKIK